MKTDHLSDKEKIELVRLLELKKIYRSENKWEQYFPDKGPLRRELYGRHLEFFKAGATYNQRLFLAANRVGKSLAGCYEVALHLTGDYPSWWEGVRYTKPTDFWVCGDTSQTVRDIGQFILLGNTGNPGTGLIPKKYIGSYTRRCGLADTVDAIEIKHISGGMSSLGFKSYSSGRISFQGTAKTGILLDEECPNEIYEECLLRTMTTNGMIMLTFTPLLGLTPLVMSFQESETKHTTSCTWYDVPHLSEEQIEIMLASLHPHQRDARSRGIPSLGSGVIYPLPPSSYEIPGFEIPSHFKKCYALDVGWNNTACLWGAINPEDGMKYIFSEHKTGSELPVMHAEAIKGRGDWIPGVIDPASRGRSQGDGIQLLESYVGLGLNLETAKNSVQSGIYVVWEGLSTGKIKVFDHLSMFQKEIRLYRRDERGNIVKKDDHLMDCLRYLHNSGFDRAKSKPEPKINKPKFQWGGQTWMS